MIFCIDTQICVWGIKRQASKGQEEMIQRAEQFFDWVDTNKHQILIPSIVIAEMLSGEPVENHPKFMEIIESNFMVAQFDTRAASRYAQIMSIKFEDLKRLAIDNGIRREKMKLDQLIMVCALVNGASSIYTNDSGLKNFSDGLIDVKELPPLLAKQADLFSNTEGIKLIYEEGDDVIPSNDI